MTLWSLQLVVKPKIAVFDSERIKLKGLNSHEFRPREKFLKSSGA